MASAVGNKKLKGMSSRVATQQIVNDIYQIVNTK